MLEDNSEALRQNTTNTSAEAVEMQMAEIAKRLSAIENLPALHHRPDHYVEAFERGGRRVLEGLTLDMAERIAQLERISVKLGNSVDVIHSQPPSSRKYWIFALVGFLFGALLATSVERLFPPPPPHSQASVGSQD